MNTKDLSFPLWSHVLVYLYNHKDDEKITALKICNEIDSTTGSISTNILLLKNNGLIEFERKGRINKYVLTDKGVRIAELLNKTIIAIK